MDDGLSVRSRCEGVSAGLEQRAKRVVIVDLAVEYDLDITRFVRDRLLATLHVDDAQTAHAESHTWPDEVSLVIGTAMPDGSAHPRQRGFDFVRCLIPPNKSRDSTH